MDFRLVRRSGVRHRNVLSSRFRGFDRPSLLLLCVRVRTVPHVLFGFRLWLYILKALLHFSKFLIKAIFTVSPDILIDLCSDWVG